MSTGAACLLPFALWGALVFVSAWPRTVWWWRGRVLRRAVASMSVEEAARTIAAGCLELMDDPDWQGVPAHEKVEAMVAHSRRLSLDERVVARLRRELIHRLY